MQSISPFAEPAVAYSALEVVHRVAIVDSDTVFVSFGCFGILLVFEQYFGEQPPSIAVIRIAVYYPVKYGFCLPYILQHLKLQSIEKQHFIIDFGIAFQCLIYEFLNKHSTSHKLFVRFVDHFVFIAIQIDSHL